MEAQSLIAKSRRGYVDFSDLPQPLKGAIQGVASRAKGGTIPDNLPVHIGLERDISAGLGQFVFYAMAVIAAPENAA